MKQILIRLYIFISCFLNVVSLSVMIYSQYKVIEVKTKIEDLPSEEELRHEKIKLENCQEVCSQRYNTEPQNKKQEFNWDAEICNIDCFKFLGKETDASSRESLEEKLKGASEVRKFSFSIGIVILLITPAAWMVGSWILTGKVHNPFKLI